MFLVHTFIIFALYCLTNLEAMALSGIDVLERYSIDIMTSYHGELEEQVKQEKVKKHKAEAAVVLITTGFLPISDRSLPTTLSIDDIRPVTVFKRPPYHSSKHFGISKTRIATRHEKILYMELMMAAYHLEVDVKSLLNNAMKTQSLAHLSKEGKHLWLLRELWETLEKWKDPATQRDPISYFAHGLSYKKLVWGKNISFSLFFGVVKNAFPNVRQELKFEEALRQKEEECRAACKRMGMDLMEGLPLFDYTHADKTAKFIEGYLKEFKEGPHYFIRYGIRYSLRANTVADPKSGLYRTLPLEIGKRVKANYVLNTPLYVTKLKGHSQEIRLINYLRGHHADLRNHPKNQELKAREGKIPLLEHLNPTTVVFSYPSPFLDVRSVSPPPESILSIREEAPVLRSRYSIGFLLKQKIASIYYMDVLAFYYIDSRHSPASFPSETMHYIREGIQKELGSIEEVMIAAPFIGPRNHLYVMIKSDFTTTAPRVHGWQISITVDQSYIFEFDPSTEQLVRKIKCPSPILWSSKDDADKPQYVFIPSQGYLCTVVGSPESLCNILIFDLIQGKEVTKIDFKSLLVDGDHTQVVPYPYLAVHSLAYFPDYGKLSASLLGFQSTNQNKRLEVVMDLAKLLGY